MRPFCLHDDGMLAVARFRCKKGCAVFPNVLEQDLCAQHIVGWGFIDDEADVIEIYDEVLAKELRIISK